MRGRVIEIKNSGAHLRVLPVTRRTDLPAKVRQFDEKMMQWYHRRGMHRSISADDLIKRFPTFLVKIGSFTLSIQSGGKKYPKGFSLTVFNPRNVVVDDRNYMLPKSGEKIPKRWPHGAFVVNGTKPMKFTPRNPKHPRFFPPR